MDGRSFDDLARRVAGPWHGRMTRRAALGAAAGGILAALGLRHGADAQVTQAQCGNKICKNNPGKCNDGCVCCVYANGNSRCRPPGTCAPGVVACPAGQTFCPQLGRCAACCEDADCDGGNACTDGACVCQPVDSGSCTSDQQCCQDEPTLCGVSPFGGTICCRPVGGTCTIFTDCCVLIEGEIVNSVVCSRDGICGGAGVECTSATECASGLCCGASRTTVGACCAAGQRCVADACVGP